MRLVLDTNVLISAAFWNGPEWRLLQTCLTGSHQLVVSPFILEELRRVMSEKFEVPEADIGAYVMLIVQAAVLVEPARRPIAVRADPSDNRILEAAMAAGADRIVTGDRHLLDLKEYQGIRICRAADL
jgi:putative PIN family toxin of toxin-antitoxin system